MTFLKTALAIAGSDSSGGAGIQADIKTMTAHGVYSMTVITALTAQNTLGIDDILPVGADFVAKQTDAVFSDIFPDAVKTGMIPDKETARTICERLKYYGAVNIVVDPVMVSGTGTALAENSVIGVIERELFPMAKIITPNIPECELLSEIKIKCEEDMHRAAEKLWRRYGCAVVCKGGHSIDNADDVLVCGGKHYVFPSERIDNPNSHGTGCTLSSAIASNLAKGYDVPEALRLAKEYVYCALAAKLDIGKGCGPLDHMSQLHSEFTDGKGEKQIFRQIDNINSVRKDKLQ